MKLRVGVLILLLAGMSTPVSAIAQRPIKPLKPPTGVIQGTLIFPSNVLPAQKVCAVQVDTERTTCMETRQNQDRYRIYVSPGTYHVFTTHCTRTYAIAQTCADGYSEQRAYYNAFVQCGLTYQCQQQITQNAPILVTIEPGSVHKDINPHDWYGVETSD